MRGVSEAGLLALTSSRSLRWLVLDGVASLSGSVLKTLGSMTTLERLSLQGCPALHADDQAALRQARPDLWLDA